MSENFSANANSGVIPNCSALSSRIAPRDIARTCPSLSHLENNAYVHKTTELGRLGRMHYARAYSRCITRSQKRFFRSNPRKLLPTKSYFAAAFPFDSSLAALKTFETTEADSLSVLARVTVGKAGNERIQSDLIKKAWMRPNVAENLANCSR